MDATEGCLVSERGWSFDLLQPLWILENTAWEVPVSPHRCVLQMINHFSKMCWWEFKTLDLEGLLVPLQADALGDDTDALPRLCLLSCRYTQRASHQRKLLSFTAFSVRAREIQLLSSLGNWQIKSMMISHLPYTSAEGWSWVLKY